jgi:transcriptional regulator with XRE-family HTH domain
MDKHEEEAQRLVSLLRRLVKLSGRSMRSLEAEVDLRSSLLGKILSGTIRLQLVHLLKICDGLGMSPREFFEIAYPSPGKRTARSPLARELAQDVLGPEAQPGKGSGDDLDEQVRDSLRRLLEELLQKKA